MENHPIPQDITGFKFKLIGQMTIKQFIYLGTGVGIGWVIIWFFPLPGIIKWPIAAVFAITGIAFAFLPIGGRPLDLMLGNFIGAVISPTKYTYKKEGASLTKENIKNAKSNPNATIHLPGPTVNSNQPSPYTTYQTQQPTTPIASQVVPTSDQNVHITVESDENPSARSVQKKTEDAPQPVINHDQDKMAQDEKKLEEKEEKLEQDLEVAKSNENPSPVATQNTSGIEQMLQQTIKQKEELEKQLLLLQGKMAKPKTYTPSQSAPAVSTTQTPNVRKVPKEMKKQVGVANIPENPNLITGIIKDSRGNTLPNILVEVNDLDENPVRAFKTNSLGQFASATPVVNGKYHIGFEDIKNEHKFDAVEIEATGDILMPLEVISIDSREELRRELFN